MSEIQIRLREAPVVFLLGARQVGKTTLAIQIAQTMRNSDSSITVTVFDLKWVVRCFVRQNTPELVITAELPCLPTLFEGLHPLCDGPNRKATFISSNLLKVQRLLENR